MLNVCSKEFAFEKYYSDDTTEVLARSSVIIWMIALWPWHIGVKQDIEKQTPRPRNSRLLTYKNFNNL